MSTPPEEDLTHPRWELIDPTPDVHALFKEFDRRFFNERLINQCYLTWSPRMTTCAGICKYEGTNHYGMCTISLSKPLLTLRPRSDLVETLLHEMIHAYLFITEGCRNRDGADGHGPRFQEHMYRINRTANTNITIYHSFHQEVAHYKRHVWRCNGPCRARAPYFGFVRRATNRAPGRNDPWFASHQMDMLNNFRHWTNSRIATVGAPEFFEVRRLNSA
ncbi:hypothetical protein WR25_06825 [Diploscapter pachys]|uniref:SprT-like domain-containing protein n=1 Tax=Diploscapter pachys TaxID=2018661 RepID=A0A2A2JHQ0_9BILA|nr:hypothetical protein WR25_06825 [Diploscapter pachys]